MSKLCRREKDGITYGYYLTNRDEESIDIVNCSYLGNKKRYTMDLEDYEERVIFPIADRYVRDYKKIDKKEIRNKLYEDLKEQYGKIKVDDEDLLSVYVYAYLFVCYENISDRKYSADYELVIEEIMDVLKDISDKYTKVDYREDINSDDDYKDLMLQYKTIVSYLLKEYKEEKDERVIENVNIVLNKLSKLFNNLIDGINDNIVDNIIHSNRYRKNMKKVNKEYETLISENILHLLDISHTDIRLEDLLSRIPVEVLYECTKDFVNKNSKSSLNRVYLVVDKLCTKEDGSKYTQKEVDDGILKEYKSLIGSNTRAIINEYERLNNTRKHSLDKKTKYTYDPYYTKDEMDDYGDDSFPDKNRGIIVRKI